MTKGQFALLTAALGLMTMGGAGYIAYANTPPHASSGAGASADGQATSGGGGAISVPSYGSNATATPSDFGKAGTVPGGLACQNGDVQVTEQPGQGAAGHVSLLLVFQNTSSNACTLHGYPGASLVDQKGKDLLDATRTLSGHMGGAVGLVKAPVVVLAPGARASAVLEWSDVTTASGCQVQNAANLLVTPPNTTQSTSLSISSGAQVCGEFEIHPVLKGVLSQP
jgi:hypothetical protein